MSKSVDEDFEVSALYATFWRMVYMSVHRYKSNPTGELLTVMTIALLHSIDINPTVSDIARITGLAKSNVSRYVTHQMGGGFLEEVIDPKDRRQRRLCRTDKAKKEEKWHRNRTLEITKISNEEFRDLRNSDDPISYLRNILLGPDKD
jgi:DNA-binding MarR family transcriptional regulator